MMAPCLDDFGIVHSNKITKAEHPRVGGDRLYTVPEDTPITCMICVSLEGEDLTLGDVMRGKLDKRRRE